MDREPAAELTTSDLAGRADEDEPLARDEAATRDEAPAEEEASPLLAGRESDDIESRWAEVQTAFVDEPRAAVERADALVAELMQRLAETFAEERSRLESQWDRGEEVSTEDLRVALQRYRSFFRRLLSA